MNFYIVKYSLLNSTVGFSIYYYFYFNYKNNNKDIFKYI